MKTAAKTAYFVAAVALSTAILIGVAPPSQAETMPQPQGAAQFAPPSETAPAEWDGPGNAPPMDNGCGCCADW